MRLKLIEKTDGTNTSMAVVNAETGEPIQGIIGIGVLIEGGVRFLQVRVGGFLEERLNGSGIVVAQEGSVPRINGRLP